MANFIALSKLTDEGRKTVKNKPGRITEVNNEIEGMGIKVLEQYAVVGPYDFVTLIDAPDNESVLKMSVELGSRGTVNMVTLPAISIDAYTAMLKK